MKKSMWIMLIVVGILSVYGVLLPIKAETVTPINAYQQAHVMPKISLQFKRAMDDIAEKYPGYEYMLEYRFDVLNDGTLKEVKITQSSGKEDIDERYLKAVWLAGPFEPLPMPSSSTLNTAGITFSGKYGAQYKTATTPKQPAPETKPENKAVDSPITLSDVMPKKPSGEQKASPMVTSNSIENRIIDIEHAFGYEARGKDLGLRLSGIEIKLFGEKQSGSMLDRLALAEKETQKIIASRPKESLPEANQMPTNTGNTGLQIAKSPDNPMNWQYDPRGKDYISLMYLQGKPDANLGFPRFMDVPINYWIQPMSPEKTAPIKEALSEFSLYFPMEEVSKRHEADLTIEIVNETLMKLNCSDISQDALGCGGSRYKTRHVGNYALKYTKYQGFVYILADVFDKPSIVPVILHELGHAFGMQAHSNDPKDVMYAKDNSNEVGAKNLSVNDLNTLFILYNGGEK